MPAPEKLVSLLEAHTDVILKDRRDTYYGHKIFLTGGASGLILDCGSLAMLDIVKSSWVYRKLRGFRAGIQSGISLLKRVFGLARCIWTGAVGFQAYVRTAVLAANLLTLARHRFA